MIHFRNIIESDSADIIKLNDSEVHQTSPMNIRQLNELIRLSSLCRVAVSEGEVAAFLIALRENVPYQNDNYDWFNSRFQKLLYVDRVVVGSAFSGRGIGSDLYKFMFDYARSKDVPVITCEYNIDPPNFASKAFHVKFGFREVGRHWVANDTKQVSLQAAEV